MLNIENNWLEQSHRKRLPSLPMCETPAACNILKASNPPRCSLLLASHLPVALFTFCLAPYSCHIGTGTLKPCIVVLTNRAPFSNNPFVSSLTWTSLHSPIADKRTEPGASRIVSVRQTHPYPSALDFPKTLASTIVYKACISRAENKYSLNRFD